jgi:sugar lactone lactonase YvrE
MPAINLFASAPRNLGRDLVRPECVLTNKFGDVFVSDFRGGVSRVSANGEQTFWGGAHPVFGKLQTNGFALLDDGSFLVAHLGADEGGIFRLGRDNRIDDWLLEIDGKPLPPANFVYLDHQGRVWITVSTRTRPRADAYRKSCDDGFIVLVDDKSARIVADGLGYTNEVWVNPAGTELYVNATFSRELIRHDIHNNQLVNATVLTNFGAATFPDGLTMDADGYLWVTSIVSNRIIRVSPAGEQEIWLEDSVQDHIDWVEAAFQTDTMGRAHLDGNPSATLRNISSLAFGEGHVLLGCLLGDRIKKLDTGIQGIRPAHWSTR